MKTYTIEKPQEADYPELVTVWEASVRATHDFLPEDDIVYFRQLILTSYLQAVDLHCVRIEGAIAGFSGVSGPAVEMLFIHPGFRGMGIGRELLRHAVQELEAYLVDVNEQNHQAAGFYKKMGFREFGRSAIDGAGKPYPILHMEYKDGL